MRKFWIFLPVLSLGLAACGPRDSCEVPVQPKLLSVNDMSREQKANALGVPPDRIPVDQPAAESPASQSAYAAYVDEHNRAVQTGFCVDNEAYKARGMKDEMSTVAHAVMATCHEGAEADTLATVLKYRNCATGNK
jgi:hypothetical protein